MAARFGLNARGAMEIILALLVLQYKLVTATVFVIPVITAIRTAAISGPLVQRAMARAKPKPA